EVVEEAGIHPASFVVSDDGVEEKVSELLQTYGEGLGLVAHNDMTAFRCASVIMRDGYRVGEDVGVTGFDNTYLAKFTGLALTSIDQDADRMAEECVRLLREKIAGRKSDAKVVLPTKLVRRASSVRSAER